MTEKGGEAKVGGDEIKREGLKSITNYDDTSGRFLLVRFTEEEKIEDGRHADIDNLLLA